MHWVVNLLFIVSLYQVINLERLGGNMRQRVLCVRIIKVPIET